VKGLAIGVSEDGERGFMNREFLVEFDDFQLSKYFISSIITVHF
jgi:hypothetical protein